MICGLDSNGWVELAFVLVADIGTKVSNFV